MEKESVVSIGTTVYLECQKGSDALGWGFLQVFFTPQGKLDNGKIVPVKMVHRQLSATRSRTTWKQHAARDINSTGTPVDLVPAYEVGASVMVNDGRGSLGYALNQLSKFGYVAVRQPIYVDTTTEDLLAVSSRKTPYGILTRINRSRKQLGWPTAITIPAKAGV